MPLKPGRLSLATAARATPLPWNVRFSLLSEPSAKHNGGDSPGSQVVITNPWVLVAETGSGREISFSVGEGLNWLGFPIKDTTIATIMRTASTSDVRITCILGAVKAFRM